MAPQQRRGTSSHVHELAAFLLFGGTAAGVNLALGWELYGTGLFPQLPYWCATAIAASGGLLVNFALNYAFNFKFRDRSAMAQFGTFCVVSLVGIALTSALSAGLLSLFTAIAGPVITLGGVAVRVTLAAHVGAVGLTVLYSFPAHKAVSFNIGIRARLARLRLAVS